MGVLSSLRGRLLALVLVGVLPSFAILTWAERSQRRLLVAQVEDDAREAARLVAERHQRAVDRARGLLAGVSMLPSLRRLDGAACSREVAEILRSTPLYANVGGVAPDGTLFCSAAPHPARIDLSDRPHVRGPFDRGQFTAGGYMTSRSRGFASFGFGQPVRDGKGSVVAVAVASFDLGQLQQELDALELPGGADVAVVDREGLVVTARPGAAERAGSPLPAPILLPMHARDSVVELEGEDGVRRIFAFHDVRGVAGDVAMRVAAGIPAAAAYAPVNRILRESVLASLAVALLAIVAAIAGGELLVVRRLRAVIAASRRLAAGDGAARTGLSPGRDEIGQLAHAFDDMAGALERLSSQNRMLLDAAGDGIVGVDAGCRITFVNPAAARALGWSAEEMLGRDAHSLFHAGRDEGSPAAERCRILGAIAAGVQHGTDETLWRRDGTSFPADFVATPLLDAGRPVGIVLVFKDVSERRRLEERLRHAEKMEAIGQLAGGVAHDFNNLLTAIVACARVLRDGLPDDHELRPDVLEIEVAAARATALTRQLLAFGRRQRLAPRPVELSAVVRDMESMLQRLLPEDVELVVETAAPATVLADPAQLEMVVMNLAVNARDAMPGGGRIELRVSEVGPGEAQDDGLPPGPLALLVVKDEGAGIDPAVQERIFEPFFTTKPAGKGTGLGLATVYGVVSQSGGAIRVRSEPGRGAEFRVYLPREVPAAAPAEARRGAPANGAPAGPPAGGAPATARGEGTPAAPAANGAPAAATPGNGASDPAPAAAAVLLVEDDAAIRTIARRTLSRAGYRVLDAGTPADALEVARGAGAIDLLLSDVILPGRNGWELSRELAARRPGLRVLFMSGYAAQHTGESLLPEGVPLLAKPFTPDELVERVRAALRGEAAPHPAAGADAGAPEASAAKRSA